ncbi:MAG: hypothetical protein PVH88_20780 [Ignavibacteria bacterium]|jgi:hypothetical protein
MKLFNKIIKNDSIIRYKMRLHSLIVILLAVTSAFNFSKAQSVGRLERELTVLKNSYSSETALFDSLKQTLDKGAKKIDTAKKLDKTDEDKIKKLMASTVVIADKIDEQQDKVNGIEQKIEIVKKQLDEKYTQEIDSLSALENSDNYTGSKDELSDRILQLTEKRVMVAPKIYSLSFNPQKILKINPDNAETLEEKNIYNEYLNVALEEVDEHLERIIKLNEEAAQIITLQEKTRKFLEDTEFDSNLKRSSTTTENTSTGRKNYTPSDYTDIEALVPQIQSFNLLLSQLNLEQSSNIQSSQSYSLDSLRTDLNLEDYHNLLQKVEEELLDYKLILMNKIDSSK